MERKARIIGYMETWDGIFKRSMRNKNRRFISLVTLLLGLRGLYDYPKGVNQSQAAVPSFLLPTVIR